MGFCDQERGKTGSRCDPGGTKKNGVFSSMEDFINRMTNKEVNRRTIENFIKSGAMDSFQAPEDRRLQ